MNYEKKQGNHVGFLTLVNSGLNASENPHPLFFCEAISGLNDPIRTHAIHNPKCKTDRFHSIFFFSIFLRKNTLLFGDDHAADQKEHQICQFIFCEQV